MTTTATIESIESIGGEIGGRVNCIEDLRTVPILIVTMSKYLYFIARLTTMISTEITIYYCSNATSKRRNK
uniref:Uncharacterized protein n=1 Tax=Trichogramma kaykai TaxID=54128 RepID=A0ABD2W060_9HYME